MGDARCGRVRLTTCSVRDQWVAQASQIERQEQGSKDGVDDEHGEPDEVRNLVRSDTIGGEGENDRRKNEVKGLTCGDCMSMRRESSKGILVYTKIQCSTYGSKQSKDIQNGIFQVPTR